MSGAAAHSGGGAVRRLRASWRLARALLHALHGALVCAFAFPFLTDSARGDRVRWWAARMLDVLGIRLHVVGTLHDAPVLLCANHVSWLDVLALDALRPVRFVAKAELRRWPLLGFMIASGGTLFIERERRRDAVRVVHRVAETLQGAATVAVFPEGTTGDGRRLLPLHGNLLQAAIASAAPLQPVALRYADATDAFSFAAAYVGATTLLESAWRIACAERLVAHVHALPVMSTTGAERRALARRAGASIQAALDAAAAGEEAGRR